MSGREDEILEKELEKLGVAGRKTGARLVGISQLEKIADDAPVVRKAASKLPTGQYQEECVMEGEPKRALQKAYDVLKETGRVLEENERDSSLNPRISGVVGSGFLGKNPAVIHVEIVDVLDTRCTLRVTGSAKEGLIKQGTAEKAVKKVIRELEARK